MNYIGISIITISLFVLLVALVRPMGFTIKTGKNTTGKLNVFMILGGLLLVLGVILYALDI